MADFFDQTLYNPGSRRGRFGARLQELNRQAMPEAADPNQGAGARMQSALGQQLATDHNRAETVETPWRGQIDPFGDV